MQPPIEHYEMHWTAHQEAAARQRFRHGVVLVVLTVISGLAVIAALVGGA